MAGDDEAIKDQFAVSLKFGTAGLRGVIGAGTNRMNVRDPPGNPGPGKLGQDQGGSQTVAISFDSRNKSDVFARAA